MAFRVVYIENETYISTKLNNIVLKNNEKDIWIPVRDVSMIVIDNLRISITTRLLSQLSENNIGVVICDQKHLPIGYYGSYDNHSRISKYIKYQIAYGADNYNKLWKNIIIYKINNQAECLKTLNYNNEVIEALYDFKNNVADGDTTNREAHAAKIYFNEMMGESFSRGNDDILLNSGLDYIYSIIRSFICRVCVAYGLNTQLGIHHKSEYNRFNLVDDLIEPIRPIADYYVYNVMKNETYFKPEHRHSLVNFLNHRIKYKNKEMYLGNMIEELISDYSSLLRGKREGIIYPNFSDYKGE